MIQQKEFTIDGYDFQFRFAKMNAIEILALQTQLTFNSIAQSQINIESMLERIEVKIGDSWTLVKMKGRQVYTPTSIEENIDLVSKLCSKFMDMIINPLFQKSEESK